MPDDVQAKIAKAKAAGYSDAEIQAYLAKAGPTAISGQQPSSTPSGGGANIDVNIPEWLTTKDQPHEYIGPSQAWLSGDPQEAAKMKASFGGWKGDTPAVSAFGPTPVPGQTGAQKLLNATENTATIGSAMPGAAGLAGNVAIRGLGGLFGAAEGSRLGSSLGTAGSIGGGVTGGAAGLFLPEILSKVSPAVLRMLGLSKFAGLGGLLGSEEPAAASGAAREAAGGTAATAMPGGAAETGAGVTGAQGGPLKNSAELSSVVNKMRSGAGTPSSSLSIYTPESLASEQGMNTAALGKGGFNLTIPPEQQKIMQMVAEGKVPMGGAPKPGGFESLFRKEPFPSPQPPSGTSPSFGEPEGPLDAAIRGAAGQNPVIKATDKAMAGEMPNKIKLLESLRRFKKKGL